jgi:hypothetical protein
MNGRLFTCAITTKCLICLQVLELSSNTVKRWLLEVVGVDQVLSTAACDKCQTLQRTQKATTTLDWQVKIDKWVGSKSDRDYLRVSYLLSHSKIMCHLRWLAISPHGVFLGVFFVDLFSALSCV